MKFSSSLVKATFIGASISAIQARRLAEDGPAERNLEEFGLGISSMSVPEAGEIVALNSFGEASAAALDPVVCTSGFTCPNGEKGYCLTTGFAHCVDECCVNLPPMSAKAGKMEGEVPPVSAKAGKVDGEVPSVSAKVGKETSDEMTVSGKSSKAPMVCSIDALFEKSFAGRTNIWGFGGPQWITGPFSLFLKKPADNVAPITTGTGVAVGQWCGENSVPIGFEFSYPVVVSQTGFAKGNIFSFEMATTDGPSFLYTGEYNCETGEIMWGRASTQSGSGSHYEGLLAQNALTCFVD